MNSVSWNIELKCYNELQQMLQIMELFVSLSVI